jgi:hypothetical protein
MMKIFFLRLAVMFLLILFELAFLETLFPALRIPVVPLAAVVAWTLIIGFPRSLRCTLPLTILFDLLSFGALTSLSFYGVVLAYATSFLSRRLLLERRDGGLLLYSFLAALGISFYLLLGFLRPWVAGSHQFLLPEWPFSWPHIFLVFVLSAGLFMLLSPALRRFEERIELWRQDQQLRTR